MGIVFGKHIAGQMSACAAADGLQANEECFTRVVPGYLLVERTEVSAGKLGIGILRKYIHTQDNLVRTVTLAIDQNDFTRMRELLIAKYGPPQQTRDEEILIASGSRVNGQILEWHGKSVALRFKEFGDSFEESSLSIGTTEPTVQKADARRADDPHISAL